MKQLLIVKKNEAYKSGVPDVTDLSGLKEGAICMYTLGNGGNDFTPAILDAKAEDNFAIALGRKTNPVFLIPEVDIKSLSVVKSEPQDGKVFAAELTIPTVEEGATYTLVLVKKGTVPHERRTWTATHTALKGETAEDVAARLAKYFADMAATGSVEVDAYSNATQVVIKGIKLGAGWELKGADALYKLVKPAAFDSYQDAEEPTGDKTYIQRLASECAAGKGFNNTAPEGREFIPGYPENVEDEKYNVYTLRFRVGRDSAKTRDERVWQLVHIAIPVGGSAESDVETILGVSSSSSNAGGGGNTTNP